MIRDGCTRTKKLHLARNFLSPFSRIHHLPSSEDPYYFFVLATLIILFSSKDDS